MVKVSVLITFFNQEDFVDTALESVLSQIVDFEYEVIIGDDGSSDNTMKKIEKWILKYPYIISVWQMPRDINLKYNSGVRVSMNRLNLLKHVSGKFFIFLDGDDFFTDANKLRKQVEVLENINNADCSCCAHNITLLYGDNTQKPMTSKHFKSRKLSFSKYWKTNYFHPNSILFRSRYISKIPNEGCEDYFNDNLITFLFARQGKIFYLSKEMAVYRQTGVGIWSGEGRLIGAIRSLLVYEYAKKIDSTFSFATSFRELSEYKIILNQIKNLANEKYDIYYQQAKKTHAKLIINLFDYSKNYKQNRLRIIRNNLWVTICRLFVGTYRKIQQILDYIF